MVQCFRIITFYSRLDNIRNLIISMIISCNITAVSVYFVNVTERNIKNKEQKSKQISNYFKKQYNRDTKFIPNGVNKHDILKANIITKKYKLKKDDYILYLGRIVPEKGIHYLIDAYNNFNKPEPKPKKTITTTRTITVEYVNVDKAYMNGYDDKTFKPNPEKLN